MEPRTYQEEPVRKSVLIVDGDPQSLRIVEVSLRRAGFDVQAAPDGAVALALLDRQPPDLVIADTALNEIDGFELCRRAKTHPAKTDIQFVFLARPSKASRIRSIEVGADDYLAKPVYVKEIVSRVSLLLQRHERTRLESVEQGADHVTGKLSDLSIIDLLQTIAANGKSGVVHLRGPAGARGEVYFRRGAVVDAEVGRLSGSDAIYRLFSWSEGTFEVEWRNIRRRDTVALAAPALLMEGMRRLDDWTRTLAELPPLETVFEVDYRLLAERLADIPDEVNGVLRLFDGVRSFIQVVDDCGLPDMEALTIIAKLFSEGIVRDVNAAPIGQQTPGPDLDGWLTEAGGPFGAPADSSPTDLRRSRASDASGVHRRPTAPARLIDEPSPEPIAGELGELGERSVRFADRLHTEGEGASSADGMADLRPEEPAVVIPIRSAPSSRQTLVSPSGGPVASVAGEIANGVPAAEATLPTSQVATPRATDPGIGAAPVAPLAMPRSTDPGIGPPPASGAARSQATERSSAERPSAEVEAPPARTSSPRVPALPFSDSASHWMSEGDQIQSDKNHADALEELSLPSRFRGPLLVGVAVVLVGGAIFFLRGARSSHPTEPAPVVAAAPAPVAGPAEPPKVELPVPPLAPGAPMEPPASPQAKPPVMAAAPAVPENRPPAAAAPVPEAPEFAQLLSQCQSAFDGGRIKDAAAACSAAKDANPDSGKALSLLSHVEFNRNHRKEALSWAEMAIKVDPKLADAYVIVGGVQQDAGHSAEAKVAYRKYLELAPKGQYASDLRAILETL
jgi:CheY-like chemotaxis protein